MYKKIFRHFTWWYQFVYNQFSWGFMPSTPKIILYILFKTSFEVVVHEISSLKITKKSRTKSRLHFFLNKTKIFGDIALISFSNGGLIAEFIPHLDDFMLAGRTHLPVGIDSRNYRREEEIVVLQYSFLWKLIFAHEKNAVYFSRKLCSLNFYSMN